MPMNEQKNYINIKKKIVWKLQIDFRPTSIDLFASAQYDFIYWNIKFGTKWQQKKVDVSTSTVLGLEKVDHSMCMEHIPAQSGGYK